MCVYMRYLKWELEVFWIYFLNFDVCGQAFQTRQRQEEEGARRETRVRCVRDANIQFSHILIYTTYVAYDGMCLKKFKKDIFLEK